jgi:hypothetical protein
MQRQLYLYHQGGSSIKLACVATHETTGAVTLARPGTTKPVAKNIPVAQTPAAGSATLLAGEFDEVPDAVPAVAEPA